MRSDEVPGSAAPGSIYVDGEGDPWLLNCDGTLTALEPAPPDDRYNSVPFAEVQRLWKGVECVWRHDGRDT
jgi:hypothetical protein